MTRRKSERSIRIWGSSTASPTPTGVIDTLWPLGVPPYFNGRDDSSAYSVAELAARHGLADCVVGLTYDFEPVPTDVEVGKDGYLYVTTRAGRPSGLDLGPRGKVYRVNPWNGKFKEVATGLLGPTILAISGGKLHVAEAFAGRISVIKHGRVAEYLPLPGALAIEAGRGGTLYAATGIFGPPSVVRINTHKGWRH